MTPQTTHREAKHLTPLLRCIARELDERTRAVAHLEERQRAFASTPHVHSADLGNIQAELAVHKRELRRCRTELEDLGCRVDDRDPARILGPDGGSWVETCASLDDTRFYRTAETTL